MQYETIRVEPTTPILGAEILDVDLTRPLSDRQVEDVHAALMAYQVIFFRDQALSFEQHKGVRPFVRRTGGPSLCRIRRGTS